MNTAGLNLEALAHWTFDIEGILRRHVIEVDLLSCLFDVNVCPVYPCSQTTRCIIGLQCETDIILVFVH